MSDSEDDRRPLAAVNHLQPKKNTEVIKSREATKQAKRKQPASPASSGKSESPSPDKENDGKVRIVGGMPRPTPPTSNTTSKGDVFVSSYRSSWCLHCRHAGTGSFVTPCAEKAESDKIMQAIMECENPAKLEALTALLRLKNLEMEAKVLAARVDPRPSPVLYLGGSSRGPLATVKKEKKEVQAWEAMPRNKWADIKIQAKTNVRRRCYCFHWGHVLTSVVSLQKVMQDFREQWVSCHMDNDHVIPEENPVEEALKICLKPLAEEIGDPDYKEWGDWYHYQGGTSK